MSSRDTLETLDKANVQRLVDNISQKNLRLDTDEDNLALKLIEFTEFFAIETDYYKDVFEKDGKTPKLDNEGKAIKTPIDIPYQFQKTNHAKFKSFTIPISRALWSITKVVHHERQELYKQEIPMPNFANQIPSKMEGNGAKDLLGSLKDIGKRLYKDPHSPYNESREQMDYLSAIPSQWTNMLHIFELNIRVRPRINTRHELDKIMNDLVVVFNSYIEPYLLQTVHLANIIVKAETEDRIVNILTTYNQIAERHEKMMMGQPPQPPQ